MGRKLVNEILDEMIKEGLATETERGIALTDKGRKHAEENLKL